MDTTTDARAEKEAKEEKDAKALSLAFVYLQETYDPEKRPRVDSVNIKGKGTDFIVTLKRTTGEGPEVCFIISNSVSKAIRKAAVFYRKKKLGWRKDEWARARLADKEEDW